MSRLAIAATCCLTWWLISKQSALPACIGTLTALGLHWMWGRGE